MTRTTRLCWMGMLLVALAGCGEKPAAPVEKGITSDVNFLADNAIWQTERRSALLAPDGWTSLVGLHWLTLKAHYIGSGDGSGIKLEVGPPKLGLVQQDGDKVFFTPERGVAMTADGKPLTRRIELVYAPNGPATVIGFDDGADQVTLIRRGPRFGLRIKSANAPARVQFTQLDYWQPEPGWRIEGKFTPSPAGTTLSFVDMVGNTIAAPSPGVVEFQHDGKPYRLTAMEGDDGGLFFVMADRTSGHGSYPAGRFLDVAKPDASGKVVLDFNHAYNPPCVFTRFATCPLPPAENRLDLLVDAGEKMYTGPVGSH
ncbi:hypothetical protein SAMN05428989_0968 [Pseudoxanthomonas sp. GM95]|uniref:DUF1684 domain-containing protein n=1 Tax=Pseudoxanthomonas sp. GM95 TaxID=1881043 RepID=UPI0008CB679E|nr:DUF1684 domain-containing protein [Pseudoxanthomonas sp. GM95]SEK86847.1 hypothetical protein SAMN05428989_0968 [Pseudoxanthomonas sp. GM95]